MVLCSLAPPKHMAFLNLSQRFFFFKIQDTIFIIGPVKGNNASVLTVKVAAAFEAATRGVL